MTKSLERDLGLYTTITVSIGAMIGVGIFVLPGLAAAKAGPSAILAYLLAGLVALPAALSKAEMATALPEAGGTYLYIDRAMGPLPGTIAGIGTWFALVFKSAFALVGLGAYLLLFVPIPDDRLVFVSLTLGVLLLVVNALGAKLTGRLQVAIVSLVLLVLLGFVGDGMTYVESGRYHPFFTHRTSGLFEATGLVFVSYAGVTTIASVAEEVENPARNIPIAIVTSVLVMMALYSLTVFVVVGVLPIGAVENNLTSIVDAAVAFTGSAGGLVLSVVAVLALTSMANAGILSSSKYPLAMSRDDLAPAVAAKVSDRFRTPVVSIAFTGGVLLVLIAVVPVVELAKLASAFQILLFALVNGALIALRESSLDWYDPAFVAPGYPYVQIGGGIACLLLLTQMGLVPMVGAVGILLGGVVWYWLYGRHRTKRESAALVAVRRTADARTLQETQQTLDEDEPGNILVAMDRDTTLERERGLLTVAANVAASTDARVYAVRFEVVPEQLTLSSATDMTQVDREFEADTRRLAESLPAAIEPREVVSHNVGRAVVNVAADIDATMLLGEWHPELYRAELLGRDVDYYMERAPCDVVFVRDRGFDDVDEIAVLARHRPYGPRKVRLANAFAEQADASLRFVTAVGEDPTDEQLNATREFHRELSTLCTVPVEMEIVRGDDRIARLITATAGSDLAVVGTVARSGIQKAFLDDAAVRISSEVGCSVLIVHQHDAARRGVLSRLVRRLAY